MLVFRGAYTISSYLEGTGTNLRLPLNPPFEQEFDSIYNIAGAHTNCRAARSIRGFPI